MVYTGKPSAGCYLCRKRKIKCDEARPTCRNCAVHRVQCPGYPDSFIIYNETNKIRQLAKKRGASKRSIQVSRIYDVPVIGSVSAPLADLTWEDRALCYFFDQYTVISSPEQHSHNLEFLPDLYISSRLNSDLDNACSSLRWAVEATALSALANSMKIPSLVVKARQSHGNALRSVNMALRSPHDATRDETFAAVVLLSFFEDINGERMRMTSSHAIGFHLLMKLRGKAQLSSNRGRSLFGYAYRQLQVDMLNLGGAAELDLSWLIGVLDRSDGLQGVMYTIAKISRFAQEIRWTLTVREGISDILTEAKIRSWIEIGISLDSELSRWHEKIPETWLPRTVQSKEGEPLLTYADVSIAGFWYRVASTRIVLQGTLLDILHSTVSRSVCGEDCLADAAKLIEIPPPKIVEQMISDMCRSIPFCLGDVDTFGNPVTAMQSSESRRPRVRAADGYELLWSLWFITACVEATPEQVKQAKMALMRLGSMFGIKLASAMANKAGQAFPVPYLR